MYTRKTVKELIESSKKGDIAALETLLKDVEKDTYSYLHYLVKDENEISDMVQEVLIKIVKNIKSLKDSDHFKSWLYKIISRQYYDCIRKRKNSKIVAIDENEICETIPDKGVTPVCACINHEIIGAIRNSILKLQEPYREAILMREFKGFSYNEIANLTKSNIGTVKSRIARARSLLKEDIKPYVE